MFNSKNFAANLQLNLHELRSNYDVLAYEKNQLISFIKLLVAFVVLKDGNTINAQLYSKMQAWFKDSTSLQKEVKVTAQVANLMKFVSVVKTEVKANKLAAYYKLLDALMFAIKEKPNRQKLMETNNTTLPLNSLINNVLSIIRDQKTDSAYMNMTRNVSILGEPQLSAYFVNSKNKEGAEAVKLYLKWVKNLTGENLEYVPFEYHDEIAALKPTKRDQWKIVSAAESKAYKTALMSIIRASGEPLMSADELKQKLAAQGMTTWRIPDGFVGKYDDKGNMYLNDGRQLNANQLGGTMRMLKEQPGVAQVAMGKGVRVGNDPSKTNYGKETAYQTLEKTKQSSEKKFDLVRSILPRLRELAMRWRADFVNESGREKLLGAIAETMYATAGRMGSPTGKPGISVLKAKNIILQGRNINIKYVGKDEVDQNHIIKPSTNPVTNLLIEFLTELKQNKAPNDYLWEYQGVTVTPNDFRKYLRDDVGFEASPHKFRHLKGTDLFNRLLAANPIPKNASKAEIDKHIQEIVLVIGGELGHVRRNKETGDQTNTWRTAIKAYVDPEPIRQIYIDRDKPFPSWLPQTSAKEDTEE